LEANLMTDDAARSPTPGPQGPFESPHEAREADPLAPYRDDWVVIRGLVRLDLGSGGTGWCAVRRHPHLPLAEGQVLALDADDVDTLVDLLREQALIDKLREAARVFPPTAKPLLSGPTDDPPPSPNHL
jgi:hypothetical protein